MILTLIQSSMNCKVIDRNLLSPNGPYTLGVYIGKRGLVVYGIPHSIQGVVLLGALHTLDKSGTL